MIPGQTGRLTVGRKIALTLTFAYFALWLGLALSEGHNRMGISFPSLEDKYRLNFGKVMYFSYLNIGRWKEPRTHHFCALHVRVSPKRSAGSNCTGVSAFRLSPFYLTVTGLSYTFSPEDGDVCYCRISVRCYVTDGVISQKIVLSLPCAAIPFEIFLHIELGQLNPLRVFTSS
jgi:hypothetical protein